MKLLDHYTEDKWRNWRGVFYICYHAKKHVLHTDIANANDLYERAIKENRVLSHWLCFMFDKNPCQFEDYHPVMKELIENPCLVRKL